MLPRQPAAQPTFMSPHHTLDHGPRGRFRRLASGVLLTALVGAVALVGCGEKAPSSLTIHTTEGGGGQGGYDGDGDDELVDAFLYFAENVHPELSSSCAACHVSGLQGAPVFLDEDVDESYWRLVGTAGLVVAPPNSHLLLHGEHSGPALSEAQEFFVSEWLWLEAVERGYIGDDGDEDGDGSGGGGGSGSGGTTLLQALTDFGECMSLDAWIDTGMHKLPSFSTDAAGPCAGCHNAGEGGTFLNLDSALTFEKNRQFPFIKRLVTGTVDSQGNFGGLAPSNRFLEKGGEPCSPNTLCHPKFTLSPSIAQSVTNFVQETLDRYEAGECAGPGG